ncbi:MAG: holo-ACP synthase [Solirubrobacteraceae bacterium]
MRVGFDIVDVAEVEESIRIHAARYLERVYTPLELADCACRDGPPDARRLATRFAAKEATLKAFGVSAEAVPWPAIELCEDCALALTLTGAAAELARARGISALSVSVTRTRHHAGAIVIALNDSER